MPVATPKPINIPMEERLSLADRLNFFKELVNHQRIKVIKQLEGQVFLYPQNAIILEEGDQTKDLFIILKGSVSIQKGIYECVPVATIQPGDFFGEISFINHSPRNASAIAVEDTIVLRLSQKNFDSLDLAVQLLIKDKISKKLILRLNQMNETVLKLMEKA